MKELIKKYKARLRELKREYNEHREKDPYKCYVYGKILTYELVIKDLKKIGEETSDNERGNR